MEGLHVRWCQLTMKGKTTLKDLNLLLKETGKRSSMARSTWILCDKLISEEGFLVFCDASHHSSVYYSL